MGIRNVRKSGRSDDFRYVLKSGRSADLRYVRKRIVVVGERSRHLGEPYECPNPLGYSRQYCTTLSAAIRQPTDQYGCVNQK